MEKTNQENSVVAEQVRRVYKAFDRLSTALRASSTVLFKDNIEERDKIQEDIGKAFMKFFEYTKNKGYWLDFVNEENRKTIQLITDEFVADMHGNYKNKWGDGYSTDPVTGLLEQNIWGY